MIPWEGPLFNILRPQILLVSPSHKYFSNFTQGEKEMLRKLNYFEIFGMKPKFNLNLSKLKDTYYTLSKRYHPDSGSKDDNFQVLSSAYSTLKNDLKRASYLNEIRGIKNSRERWNDVGFLSGVMEMEEKISNGREHLSDLKKKIEKKIEECKKNYDKNEYLNRWKYYDRLVKRIKKLE
jgi:molecular chaperone HscB